MMEGDYKDYLGDGLYVSFDGWHIVLRVPREDGDHIVALDPDVFNALLRYKARIDAIIKAENED